MFGDKRKMFSLKYIYDSVEQWKNEIAVEKCFHGAGKCFESMGKMSEDK
jgi:hypothetical protein